MTQFHSLVNTAEKNFLAFGNITSALAARTFLFANIVTLQKSTTHHTKLTQKGLYLKVSHIIFVKH